MLFVTNYSQILCLLVIFLNLYANYIQYEIFYIFLNLYVTTWHMRNISFINRFLSLFIEKIRITYYILTIVKYSSINCSINWLISHFICHNIWYGIFLKILNLYVITLNMRTISKINDLIHIYKLTSCFRTKLILFRECD